MTHNGNTPSALPAPMDTATSQLLALLRSGLWGEPADAALFPPGTAWEAIFAMSKRQTVRAIAFDGLTTLPKALQPPKPLLMKWYVHVLQTEDKARRLNKAVRETYEALRHADVEPTLLKGQGVAQCYPRPHHRQSGDIDIFTGPCYGKVNTLLLRLGATDAKETTWHCSFSWHGAVVENHRSYVAFNHLRNIRLFRAWAARQTQRSTERIDGFPVTVFTPQTNAIYLFMHIFHHFLWQGVGLRQVADWAMLLVSRRDLIDAALLRADLERLPIRRGACAFAYVCVRHLGMPPDAFPFDLTSPRVQRDGEFVMADILRMGNFGHDTDMMRSFDQGSLRGRLRAYRLAVARFVRIFRFCPSEVMAYPLVFLLRKVHLAR